MNNFITISLILIFSLITTVPQSYGASNDPSNNDRVPILSVRGQSVPLYGQKNPTYMYIKEKKDAVVLKTKNAQSCPFEPSCDRASNVDLKGFDFVLNNIKDTLESININGNANNQKEPYDIPLSLFECQNLKRCAFENATCLPGEISRLTNLTHLNFSYSDQETFPDLSSLTKLTHVFIRGTQMAAWPVGLSNLTNLKHLEIANNEITEFPDHVAKAFGCLINLETLKICRLNNDVIFEEIPDSILNLPRLKTLILSTGLTSLIGQANLPILETLDVRFNDIENLPPIEWFQNLPCLKKMVIAHNPLNSNAHNRSVIKKLEQKGVTVRDVTQEKMTMDFASNAAPMDHMTSPLLPPLLPKKHYLQNPSAKRGYMNLDLDGGASDSDEEYNDSYNQEHPKDLLKLLSSRLAPRTFIARRYVGMILDLDCEGSASDSDSNSGSDMDI